MFQIILYQPEIPPNTGNIIRLCANTGSKLHLIKPLGFDMDDKKLRRAGLDYHEWANVSLHTDLNACLENLKLNNLYALSTKGSRNYTDVQFTNNDGLLFGPETRGLPSEILNSMNSKNILKIPQLENSRSLNLSNCAAIVTYEAWRQLGFN